MGSAHPFAHLVTCRALRASLVVPIGIVALAGGCRRSSDEARPDPGVVESASKASGSAVASNAPVPSGSSSSRAITVATIDPSVRFECEDGRLRFAGAASTSTAPWPAVSTLGPFDGGLGLRGTGAGGSDSFDAGTATGASSVGALGSLGIAGRPGGGSPRRPVFGGRRASRVRGHLVAPVGAGAEPIARAMCGVVPALRACAETAGLAGHAVTGPASLSISLRTDGSVEKATATMPPSGSASVAACFETAAAGARFPAGTGPIEYALGLAWTTRAPKLVTKGIKVIGPLPEAVITRIVRANLGRLRYCYEQLRVTDPAAEGTLSTSFVIDASGKVSSAKIDAGTITDAKMRACVQKVFGAIRYPEPSGGGSVNVTYPIDFSES